MNDTARAPLTTSSSACWRTPPRPESRSGTPRRPSRPGRHGIGPRAPTAAVRPRGARRAASRPGLSTELEDVTEVEYRQLRLGNVVLIGVYSQGSLDDAENSHARARGAGRDGRARVLDGVLQRRRIPTPHPPRPRQGRGAAPHRGRPRRRHRRSPTPSSPRASGVRSRTREGQGHRPHHGHPRHLQPAREESRGQGPGRARPASSTCCRACGWAIDVPPGRWPGRRRRCGHGLARSR